MAQTTTADGELIWYRGHRDNAWKLRPSLARMKGGLDKEAALTNRFKAEATRFLDPRPEMSWDWLFLMQHYGVPTRLLDWTESPLVAMYFAVAPSRPPEPPSSPTPDTDSCVWALWPQKLNALAGIVTNYAWEIPVFGESIELNNYSPEGVSTLPGFLAKPAAAMARRQFARVIAQYGVFTIIQRDNTPIEELGTGDHVTKYVVPKKAKPTIKRELEVLNIRRLTLFPELERVGEQVAGYLT